MLQTIAMVRTDAFVSRDLLDSIVKNVRNLPHLDVKSLILHVPDIYIEKTVIHVRAWIWHFSSCVQLAVNEWDIKLNTIRYHIHKQACIILFII